MTRNTLWQAIWFCILFSHCCRAQWVRVDSSNETKFRNGTVNILSMDEWKGTLIGCGSYVNTDTAHIDTYSSISPIIIASSDRGKHWSLTRHPLVESKTLAGNFLTSVSMDPSGNGVSVGARTCLRTEDGGKTWNSVLQQNTMARHNMRHISRFDSSRVIVSCIDAFVLYYTTDGGGTWTSIADGPTYAGTYYETVTAFVDSNTIFVSRTNMFSPGDSACGTRFSLTSDLGKTWKSLGCTVAGFEGDSSNLVAFSDIKFCSKTLGYAMGGITNKGNTVSMYAVFKSVDGGNTWTVIDSSSAQLENGYVFMSTIGSDTIVITSSHGSIRASTDGGHSWFIRNAIHPRNPFASASDENFRSVLCLGFDTTIGCVQRFSSNQFFAYEYVDDRQTSRVELSDYLRSDANTVPRIESVYPVPCTEYEYFIVRLKNIEDVHGKVRVHTLLGDLVKELSLTGLNRELHGYESNTYKYTLPTSDLSPGLYFLSIIGSEGRSTVAFIKHDN